MDFLLAGGFKGHKHDKLNILKVVISSDPTDTNDLRQIRDLVGETFCRNDPSPLFSTLTIFGIDSLTTDRGSCRNRNAFIGARRIRRTRNFNFPFYFCFLQYPPLFDTLELILGALHPSLRITTTFSFLSSPLQSSQPCGSRAESRSSTSELPLQRWHSKSSSYTHGTTS